MVLRSAALALTWALVISIAVLAGDVSRADASGALQVDWGDADCSGSVDSVDALKLLRVNAGLGVTKATPDCPDIGSPAHVDSANRIWGDVDCDGDSDAVDALGILRFKAGLFVAKADPACPDAGSSVMVGPAGEEIVFEGNVPSLIDGEAMSVQQDTGDTLEAFDGWTEYFAQLGIDAAEFTAASSVPEYQSGLDISVVALTAPVDWEAALADFASSIENESDYDIGQVSLDGVEVWHVTHAGPPPVSTYYYASGDTLWTVESADEELAARVFAELPAGPSASVGLRAIPAGLPGSGPLKVVLLRQPLPPVCVAEPFGRQQLMFMVFDLATSVPVPAITDMSSILSGELLPQFAVADAAPVFQYKANLFNGPEHVQVHSTVPGGGDGFGFAGFPVQHCLNGLWMDGDVLVQVNQTGTDVTTNIVSGSLCGEETETDFEGTLIGDQLSGPELIICNPEECVDAGLLPLFVFFPFTATVALDGQSVHFTWEDTLIDFVYDDDDNLIACNETTETELQFFTITRISFGPGVP